MRKDIRLQKEAVLRSSRRTVCGLERSARAARQRKLLHLIREHVTVRPVRYAFHALLLLPQTASLRMEQVNTNYALLGS